MPVPSPKPPRYCKPTPNPTLIKVHHAPMEQDEEAASGDDADEVRARFRVRVRVGKLEPGQ